MSAVMFILILYHACYAYSDNFNRILITNMQISLILQHESSMLGLNISVYFLTKCNRDVCLLPMCNNVCSFTLSCLAMVPKGSSVPRFCFPIKSLHHKSQQGRTVRISMGMPESHHTKQNR